MPRHTGATAARSSRPPSASRCCGTGRRLRTEALRQWLDIWRGLGDVVVAGMARQDYDLELTRVDGRLAGHVFRDGDGAFAHQRHGDGVRADAMAGDAGGGVGGVDKASGEQPEPKPAEG
jgi:hypothetical protein